MGAIAFAPTAIAPMGRSYSEWIRPPRHRRRFWLFLLHRRGAADAL